MRLSLLSQPPYQIQYQHQLMFTRNPMENSALKGFKAFNNFRKTETSTAFTIREILQKSA